MWGWEDVLPNRVSLHLRLKSAGPVLCWAVPQASQSPTVQQCRALWHSFLVRNPQLPLRMIFHQTLCPPIIKLEKEERTVVHGGVGKKKKKKDFGIIQIQLSRLGVGWTLWDENL